MTKRMLPLLPGNPFCSGKTINVPGAIMSLVFEQRTANLIALAKLENRGGINQDYNMEPIYRGLGMTDE